MSADNWGTCPRCLKKAEQKQDMLYDKVRTSYGKLPSDEWISLLEESQKDTDMDTTLREDYEMYMEDNGQFYISYKCSCTVCGFNFEYNHRETVEVGNG